MHFAVSSPCSYLHSHGDADIAVGGVDACVGFRLVRQGGLVAVAERELAVRERQLALRERERALGEK